MMNRNSNSSTLWTLGVPPLPRWLLYIRLATLFSSLGVLISAVYSICISVSEISKIETPAVFLVADASLTLLIIGLMVILEIFFQQIYSRLAFILLLTFDAILWTAAWAWSASWVGQWYAYPDLPEVSDQWYDSFGASLIAATAFGALSWFLIVIVLIFYVLCCLRANQRPPERYYITEQAQGKPQGPYYIGQYPPPQPQRYV